MVCQDSDKKGAQVLDGVYMPCYAVIISIKDYEQYRHLLAQEYHKELGRRVGAAVEARNLSEDQLIANMEEDREAIYEEMYGEGS